jgi:hypothetical protein
MLKRRSSRKDVAGQAVRARPSARRPSQSVPAKPEAAEVPPQVRAPNSIAWPGPLNEEELAALEAGWGFVE